MLLWSTTSERWLRDNLGHLRPNISINAGLGRRLFKISPRYDADLTQWAGDSHDPQVLTALRAVSGYVNVGLHGGQEASTPIEARITRTSVWPRSTPPGATARTDASQPPTPPPAPDLHADRAADNPVDRLFLCYRREDTADATGRLHDRLVTAYSADRVFMDIDNVPLGVNFVTHINQQLQTCTAVLVVIGRTWLSVTDPEGNRRLDNPADHVRVELTTALKRGIPVIPILVQNAPMPRATDLPEDMRDLAFHNGLKLAPEFWRTGVERLIKELDRVMRPAGHS